MTNAKDLVFTIIVIVLVLGLAFSYAKYTTLNQELNLCTATVIEMSDTESNIDECLEIEHERYIDNWIGYCEINDIPVTNGECNIPVFVADGFNEDLSLAEDRCVARYK